MDIFYCSVSLAVGKPLDGFVVSIPVNKIPGLFCQWFLVSKCLHRMAPSFAFLTSIEIMPLKLWVGDWSIAW